MLVLVMSLSYIPKASFSEKFQNENIFITLVRCFPYAPSGSFKVELLFFTHLLLILGRCFYYTSHISFSEVFLLHR